MAGFELGLVLSPVQYGPERTTPRWAELREVALRAETLGFDTIWIPDELLWRVDELDAEGKRRADGPPRGVWDGIAFAGAVAAITSRAKVGTWVMSALHRNPGIIAKCAETLDEISGGRFVFGLGAGHEWPGQAHAFGLPEDRIFARFEEALQIIVPLIRGGHADFEGTFHAARDLPQAPRGPRPGRMPLLIGGNGPKGQRLAVRHADIWSAYVEERAHVDEVGPRIASLDAICAEEGRDPTSIGRSIGAVVNPTVPVGTRPSQLSGPASAIAEAVLSFHEAGYTQVELMLNPSTIERIELLGTAVEEVRGSVN